jgi:hypothetical protein
VDFHKGCYAVKDYSDSVDVPTVTWKELASLPKDGPLARVHVLSNEIEAHVLHDVLEQEKVIHYVECYRDTAYDGLFQASRGWGAIITREEDSERALAVIQRALSDLLNTEDEPSVTS